MFFLSKKKLHEGFEEFDGSFDFHLASSGGQQYCVAFGQFHLFAIGGDCSLAFYGYQYYKRVELAVVQRHWLVQVIHSCSKVGALCYLHTLVLNQVDACCVCSSR